MKKRSGILFSNLVIVLVGVLLIPGVITAQHNNAFAQAKADRLTAVYTKTGPTLNGKLDDSAWADAPTLELVTAGNMLKDYATTGAKVELKALYTDTKLYIGVRWPDPTISMTRGGSWLWTGSAWKNLTGSAKAVEAGLVRGVSEDRIIILWDVNITDFATKGCAVKCHVTKDLKHAEHPIDEDHATCFQCHEDVSIGYGAFLDNPDELGDMWHSKAARALPLQHIGSGAAFLGYADDKHIIYNADPANINYPDAGRHGDKGQSAYYHNRNKGKTAPLYIETDPVDYWDAIVITQSEIDSGEAVKVAGLSSEDISGYWAKYQALTESDASYKKAVVPERILRQPQGSRADTRMAASWKDGYWTAEIERNLVTGHDDDVQFNNLSISYPFDIALFDNTGGEGHSFHVGSPPVLVFASKP